MVLLCKGLSQDTKDKALIRITPKDSRKPAENTIVLRTSVHCEGCSNKIMKTISKIKGVDEVKIERGKELITVKGTMDVKEMIPYLKVKLKRNVEVVPANNDEYEKKDNKGPGLTKKKEKEAAPAAAKKSGSKKEKEATVAGGEGVKEQLTKTGFHGYPYPPPPTYWYDGHVYGQSYLVENHRVVYRNQGNQHSPCYHAPQIFSDENPNACSVM